MQEKCRGYPDAADDHAQQDGDFTYESVPKFYECHGYMPFIMLLFSIAYYETISRRFWREITTFFERWLNAIW